MVSTDDRFQLRVQRYGWDKAASQYEQYWAAQLAPAQQQLLVMAALAPGERVIDIAAGTGLVTFPAAESVGSAGAVLAADLSDVMVEQVRTAAVARGLTQVTAERMEAGALKCSDAAFDVALCGLGLMYVPDAQLAVREMFRVLREGGRTVVAVWGARASCGWAEIFPIVDHRVRSEVCPMFFHLGGGDALRLTLEAAGFTHVAVQRLHVTLDYADEDHALGAAFAGGPVAMAYSRFDDATRAEAHAEYLASIAGYRHGSGYRIPGEFVIASAVKP